MALFSSSSSAASLARLPGFLRPESASTRIGVQNQLFSKLNQLERQRLQAANSSDSPFYVAHALQESTRDLNRYTDILPYKHSQIHVGTSVALQTQSQSSFINANRITAPPGLRTSLPPGWRGYIATQAPLPHTQSRFWRMVSEQNVHVIVSLTAVSHDRSRRSQKAERYWPAAGETDKFDSDLWVRNVDPIDSHEQVAYRHFEIWNPNDTTTDEKRQVLLVHYQGWPDHGVPSKTNDLRDILYKIRGWKAEQRQSGHKTNLMDFGPIVVHCSAGCGRTGTFCVIDTILSVLEHIQYPYLASPPGGYIPNAIESQTSSQVQEQAQRQEQEQGQGQGQQGEVYDWQSDRDIIYETLTFFRQERMLMVQTAAQYGFCYSTVRDLCQYQ